MEADNLDRIYQVYVTESMRLHGRGMYIDVPLSDFGRANNEFDPDAVADAVIERAGLVVDDEPS